MLHPEQVSEQFYHDCADAFYATYYGFTLPPMNNRKRTALCLLGAALCVFMTLVRPLRWARYP